MSAAEKERKTMRDYPIEELIDAWYAELPWYRKLWYTVLHWCGRLNK